MLFRVFTALLLAGCVILSVSGADKTPAGDKKTAPMIEEDAYTPLSEFLAALAIIRTHYVDQDKVSWKKLFQASLRGLMHELDPFSVYESPEEFKTMQENVSGKKVGIGVTLTMRARGLHIVSVTPKGPAEQAGLKAGDVVLEIDGAEVSSMDMDEAVSRIRGEEGTETLLRIYRPSDDVTKNFRVTRRMLTISSILGEKIIPDSGGTAYIRVLQFGRETADEFDKALRQLSSQGMTALIVDLRNNPGGLLSAVVPMCSRFLPPDKPIVSIEGRGDRRSVISSPKTVPLRFTDLPLVVLINGNSASASEIFAACMRDYKRAVLIGERSFGKGSVQTLIPFGEKNGAMRLTTARYFTPGRHPIHGHGIEPDIRVPLSPAVRNRLSMQLNMHPGELNMLMRDPVRDIALERALEILKGLRIFRSSHTQEPNEPNAKGAMK